MGDQPFLVYHSSADDNMNVDSETLLDGDIGVPDLRFKRMQPVPLWLSPIYKMKS